MKHPERNLVIKLSALGDFVLALPAFARIRAAHPEAKITLLTTPSFETLARLSPYFDDVETDGRPQGAMAWLALVRRLRRAHYTRVYDLQTSDRTDALFRALGPFPPKWSGTATGCALPHRNPARGEMHALERHAQQLGDAGIWPDAPTRPLSAPPPDISWVLQRALAKMRAGTAFKRPVVLLVPGASAAHPEKLWPAERYGELALAMEGAGFEAAIIGGAQEAPLVRAIHRRAPRARDLTGRTDFAQIAALGARAAVAVGGDTGPIHLIAAAGAPTIVLFSGHGSPERSAPRGHVTVLQAAELKDLPLSMVLSAALALGGAVAATAPA
jgi:ADP-heptose:LPS heptosyltransferase